MPVSAPIARFGPFEVVSRIGFGGMGEVFRARRQGQGGAPDVALKLIRPDHVSDERFRQMFLAEVRIGALLNHPNIARMVDWGQVDGVLYLATELVDGISLHRLLSSPPVALEVTVYIVGAVLDALEYAHQLCDETGRPLGLVHRDVSPTNLLLSRSGEVKLTDFGVHKVAGQMTFPGELKGKPAFMAPEQLPEGGGVDSRADLFAVGVMLHWMVTGRAPFADVRTWMSGGAPLAVQGPLGDLITLALAPDPAHRFGSAREFAATLRHAVPPRGDASAELSRLVCELATAERPLTAMERLIISELDRREVTGLVYAPDPSTGRLWVLGPEAGVSALSARMPEPARPVVTFDASEMTPTVPMMSKSPSPSPVIPTEPSSPTVPIVSLAEPFVPLSSLERLEPAPSQPPRRRSLLLFGLVAGISAAAGVLGAYALRPAPAPAPRARPSAEIARAAAPAPPERRPSLPPAMPPAPPEESTVAAAPSPAPAPAPAPPRPRPRPAKAQPDPPTGYLTLDSDPWAVVYLGSRRIGTTPFVHVPLPAGRRQLTFDVQGSGQRVRRTVEIPADGLKRVALQLR